MLLRNLQTDDLEHQKASLAVLLGYHCGLRVSEIAHLKIRDIDLTQKVLTVIGKGDKERSVPITDTLAGHLRKFFDGNPQPSAPYLFSSPRSMNKPIHPHFLETWVKKAAQWAGLENPEELTVHVLRHTFGTQLAESGASVYEIRDLMGHSSIMVSENYVKLASTSTRRAHQKAFGAGFKVHAVNLGEKGGVESVLRRFRTLRRKQIE